MKDFDLAHRWANEFGLALSPLFEPNETDAPGSHHVLLDGGYGSFALSVSDDEIWRTREPASWTWSSNLPHHVTIGERHVAVTRWDRARPELLTRTSVENQTDVFYRYLTNDRVKSSQRVVEHVLGAFRQIRALLANAQVSDDTAVDAFLAFLVRAVNRIDESIAWSEHEEGNSALKVVAAPALESVLDDFVTRSSVITGFQLRPLLAIRHAGAEIFQEAHFELVRAPAPDLFAYTGPAESKRITRGGAHFTPPALARTVVEQTFAQIPNLKSRQDLTILDPSCGSAAFLTETLRTLRRINFEGRVILRGRDISQAAISMARFALDASIRDWAPPGGCEIDLKIGDSLADDIPASDVILMNPPFVAWSALTPAQQDQMRLLLGPRLQGRGDYSMAFITRALDNLKPGGAIGTLMPASLLTLQAAEEWRRSLLDQAELRFLSSLGDYGLFAYAMVQVSALIMRKQPPQREQTKCTTALVTKNNADATGDALRVLRKARHAVEASGEHDAWNIFQMPTDNLRHRATWRLISPQSETAMKRLLDIGGACPIGDLFDVHQGVRTGMNPAFLLEESQLSELSRKERTWFRPAIMNESITSGRVVARHWVFYPYTEAGLAISTEEELRRLLPTYSQRFLFPNKARLQARANIVRANRIDWWGLSERRASWALDKRPRIVSKYFGGAGGFGLDLDHNFIVVQGFAWLPKWQGASADLSTLNDGDSSNVSDGSVRQALSAYMALMNSRRFERLLEVFSPHVAGGQFDLSPRYVNAIPIPNLPALMSDEGAGITINRLSSLGQSPRVSEPDWLNQVDRLVQDLYGGDILDNI